MAKARTLRDASQDLPAKRITDVPRARTERRKGVMDPFTILGTFLVGIAVGLLTGRFLKIRLF